MEQALKYREPEDPRQGRLNEAGEAIITLNLLNLPATLHIYQRHRNVMRSYRRQTAKVTRWRTETDQISRWSATALLHPETGFHLIQGHTELPDFLKTSACRAHFRRWRSFAPQHIADQN